MEFILVCDCYSTEFNYNGKEFECQECSNKYNEEEAGKHLITNS